MENKIILANEVFKIIKNYDLIQSNKNDDQIIGNILKSIILNEPLTLIQFTCSTINPKWLYSDEPELYISLETKSNNLEPDLPKYSEIVKELKKTGIKIRNIILIGNTDLYYIYSQQGSIYPNKTKEELLGKFNKRWELYKFNLKKWLEKDYPEIEFEVISWYELEKSFEKKYNISFENQFNKVLFEESKYFDKNNYNWEFEKLTNCFGEGKYFYNLKKPSNEILMKWIKNKFTEYALQGLWIKVFFPNCILVQNEKPSELRYKMYQPLIQKYFKTNLPNLYFYGVDNKGYQ